MLAWLLGILFVGSVRAEGARFVPVGDGREVYVEYSAAAPGAATVALVNGLIYDVDRWNDFADGLKAKGLGVIKYYFRGQMLTLRREVDARGRPEFFDRGLTLRDLSDELKQVLNALEVSGPVDIVGLSYGAAIGAEFASRQPESVRSLILMAPVVVSTEYYDPGGAWLRRSLDALPWFWGPVWGPMVRDQVYDWIFRTYITRERITEERIPPSMRDIPEVYKEAVFHHVRAARDFDLKKFAFVAGPKVHMIVAGEEAAPLLKDQSKAWSGFAEPARGALIRLMPAAHAIPDTAPVLAANLVARLGAGEDWEAPGDLWLVDESGGRTPCPERRQLEEGRCPSARDTSPFAGP